MLLFLLLCITFAWLFLYWYKHKHNSSDVNEGFQQDRVFTSKIGEDVYDSFYGEIYDELMYSSDRAQNLVDTIIHISQPTVRYSAFLDVGCGTGAVLERLDDAGYRVTGIDRSADMVTICQQNLVDSKVVGRNLNIVHGDVLDSMQFDRSQFSHVVCCGMTLYEWTYAEKLRFFRNCYFWMIAGGYLFVHLVDPLRFSPSALGAADIVKTRVRGERVVNTEIDFVDFTYRSNYEFGGADDVGSDINVNGDSQDTCSCNKRETFTDAKTQHVRENEMALYLSSVDSVVSLALRSGFVVKAKWNLSDSPYSDSHQYIFMFERI
jgi:SAM-dependent methyltransferase